MYRSSLWAAALCLGCTLAVSASGPGEDYRSWRWAPKTTEPLKYSITDSEWPSFLTFTAWDACQGCLSATGNNAIDSSAPSFQLNGEWMRVSSTNVSVGTTLSTHASRDHWLNPPRYNTDDKPLEFEWYQYFDAPEEWGWKGLVKQLSVINWSAFWAFGHGQYDYGWPFSGEWDLLEFLPSFTGEEPIGGATGFHNGNSGAYPPCCMDGHDGVAYDKNCTSETCGYTEPGTKVTTEAGTTFDPVWPYTSKFATWGTAMDKQQGTPSRGTQAADAENLYNTVLHNYARCTVDTFDIFSKRNADTANPPPISADWTVEQFAEAGYAHVFRAHADFGSNNDMTYAKAFPELQGFEVKHKGSPTNWHQNMGFVWSIVRHIGDGENAAKAAELTSGLPISSYLSDIKIRGGGNHAKAQLPTHIFPGTSEVPANATTARGITESCDQWISKDGGCTGRLRHYYETHGKPADYGPDVAM